MNEVEILRVYNEIYNLQLTETDFTELETERGKDYAGIYIHKVFNGYAICVLHDKEHRFGIIKINEKAQLPQKSRILFGRIVPFLELPPEIYTLHTITRYRNISSSKKVSSLQELKERIIEVLRERDETWLTKYYHWDKVPPIEMSLKALMWLFNDNTPIKFPLIRQEVSTIIKVAQYKNYRLAIIGKNNDGDIEYAARVFLPSDECYNWVSPNREIYENIWLDDILIGKMSYQELQILTKQIPQNQEILLTANRYNAIRSNIKREMIIARQKAQDEQAKERLVQNIKKQFQKGKVERHGITFKPSSISYEGITLKGTELKTFIVQEDIIYLTEPDFKKIYENYVEWLLALASLQGFKYSIGKVKINLKKDGKIFRINGYKIATPDIKQVLTSAFLYKSQAEYDKFVAGVSKCSLKIQKILQEGKLNFKIKIDKEEDIDIITNTFNLLISLKVKSKNNKLYIQIGDSEYKIKDINALLEINKDLRINRQRILSRTIKLLYKGIEGITPKIISQLIIEGKAEYERTYAEKIRRNKERTERSLEFIKKAVELTKAERVQDGWVVQGLSGNKYLVKDNLAVYTGKDFDKYLCIVDDDTPYEDDDEDDYGFNSQKEWVKNDRIAKRLLMLSKDVKVASEIYKRGDRVDSWWLNITGQLLEQQIFFQV